MDDPTKICLSEDFKLLHATLERIGEHLKTIGDDELLKLFERAEYETTLLMHKTRLRFEIPFKVEDAG